MLQERLRTSSTSAKRSRLSRVGYPIGLVGARKAAAADTEDEAPAADVVERRDLLGQSQRVAQRQHLDGNADLQAPRSGGDGAGDDRAARRRPIAPAGSATPRARPRRDPSAPRHRPGQRIARRPRRPSGPRCARTRERCRTRTPSDCPNISGPREHSTRSWIVGGSPSVGHERAEVCNAECGRGSTPPIANGQQAS